MSSDLLDLDVPRGLERLENLQAILAAFAREEADLARRLRDQRYRIQRNCEEQIADIDATLAVETERAETAFEEEKRRLTERHEARRARIRSLQNAAIRNLPRLAREERERWLGELQMREFLLTRKLEADRQAANAAFERASQALATRTATLRGLERRAREYFGGYLSFQRRLRPAVPPPESPVHPREEISSAVQDSLVRIETLLADFRGLALPKVFSVLPMPAILALLGLAAFLVGNAQGNFWPSAGAGALAALVVVALHYLGRHHGQARAAEIGAEMAVARNRAEAVRAADVVGHEKAIRRIQAEHERGMAQIEGQWGRGDEIKIDFEARVRKRLEVRAPRALARNDRVRRNFLSRREGRRDDAVERARAEADRRRAQATATCEEQTAAFAAGEAGQWAELAGRWRAEITGLYAEIDALNARAAAAFPEWTAATVAGWEPPAVFTPATKFGRLEVDVPANIGAPGSRLELPGPRQLSIPLALTYPRHGSLVFESTEASARAVISCLNHIVLQLFATTPPGKIGFTICDPVGLGENFAGLMHLGDYEESLITRRIWTQPDQIEERLADLSQHIEKVIQMYLRNEYATIVEYNAQAGSTAEKFHFLVIADFPASFSETALKRLQSILASGPRCGVFTLIHWDRRQSLPAGFSADELRRGCICIQASAENAALQTGEATLEARLLLDEAPGAALALDFVHRVGARSVDSTMVQVPFRAIAPSEDELWAADTTNELRVAIGRTGATKRQMLAIGKGTRQHALVAGKTGSGKSTLFHVMITNLALACSPEQVEFYLIDFKKGVEFKCYATKRLPHARVVAIESDREFGLSVLQRVDEELRRRGDLFRRLGVQDLAGYQRVAAEAKEVFAPMPRSLLLIDEFQEFFVEDDEIAQGASMLLDRIVRQGRAFGIHVLLGSQTLGGAYSLARATLGQMVIRIALQCNEADAYLIMDDNNPAPRLLSRPGEGIYNDAAGAFEGNSPFQVVWLPEEERDAWLDRVRALAERHPEMDHAPVVFEGNAPADIAANAPLARVRRMEPTAVPPVPRAWLGAPNSIKGPTEVSFPAQSGSHLLVVGQRDEAAFTMLTLALLALAAQCPPGAVRLVFLHNAPDGSAERAALARVVEATAREVTVAGAANAGELIAELADELKRRADGDVDARPIFVFVHGLQRFKRLRHEEDFDFSFGGGGDAGPKPGAALAELIAEGGAHGIHLLVSVDTFGSVNRFLSRKALAEFGMRVVFQMSANDSASLIDSPKASGLGLHRALLYHESEGTLETFRPYAAPDPAWLGEIVPALARAAAE